MGHQLVIMCNLYVSRYKTLKDLLTESGLEKEGLITAGMMGHQLVIMCNLYVFRLQDIEGSADRVGTREGRADHCTNDGSPASNNV